MTNREGKKKRWLSKCLTRDEVEAFLVFHAGFNLTGEQVESGWRFVRLRERRGGDHNQSINQIFICNAHFIQGFVDVFF